MQINDVVKRLNLELPFKLTRSRLHFYDRIKLVKVDRSGVNNNARDYTERDYVELRMCVMLSYLGIKLKSIDRLVNKSDPEALIEVKNELIGKKQVIEWLLEML